MRSRSWALGASLAIAISLLTAAPATAAYEVAISFPGGSSEFYSPFNGPATITFTFASGAEPDETFSLRLKTGGNLVHSDTAFVDGDDADGSVVRQFSWPAQSVTSPKTYDVIVSQDGAAVANESFLLRPKLVKITDASPNPFLPWIDDGFKDTTDVKFTLAGTADAEARVFRPNSSGKCCGNRVRTDSVGTNLSAGNNTWTWDGRNDGGNNLDKGDYFVRIVADDGVLDPVISNAFKVTIARTYFAKSTKSKPARNYHHVGPVSSLVLGGDCKVHVNDGDLEVLCQGAKVTVYWRWGLGANEKIVGAGFVLNPVSDDCPNSIWSKGHSKHESSFTMTEDLDGALGRCRLTTAKITYTHPEQS